MKLRQRIIKASAFLPTLGILLLSTFTAVAQPWSISNGTAEEKFEEINQICPTRFFLDPKEPLAPIAKLRLYEDLLKTSSEQGDYETALRCVDSLIYTIEHSHNHGMHCQDYYCRRAEILRSLDRKVESCNAYLRAIQAQDSLLRLTQNQELRDMQNRYALDRIALNKAQSSMLFNRTILLVLAVLLMAGGVCVWLLYRANRRTKQLQNELLQKTEQVRHSEIQKTKFINSICHEVRTPLNSITGFSELLYAPDITPETHAQYCEIISGCRRQLRDLFDDMLEVAALENNDKRLPRERVALCDLCRTKLQEADMLCHNNELSFCSEIDDREILITSNRHYLDVMLTALLSNAVKFTSKGTITLTCHRNEQGQTEIMVADTGCGIAPDQFDYVFERFAKLNEFTQGNGLGLYLCRLITDRLNCEIAIDSTYTSGARFTILFHEQ